MNDLELRLAEAAGAYPFPETPDVAPRISPRTEQARRRRSLAIIAAVAAASVVGVLGASPAARSAASGWFEWLPGVEVERTGTLRPSSLHAAPPFLGEVASLDVARASFPLRVPRAPGLGAPVVYVREDIVGGHVTLVYGDPARPELVVSQWLASSGTARYQVAGPRGRVVPTRVGNLPGLWIEGDVSAVYTYLGADFQRHLERLPVSANVLLWRDGRLAFRLETKVGSDEALSIARSLAAAPSLAGDARRALRRTGAPGVIVYANVGGRESVAAAGYSNLRRRVRARGGDRFWTGSVSKTFTATVVMQLVGEGRVGLDDPVSRWLPTLPNGGRITVRQLLNHTSGLPDYFRVPLIARRLASRRAVIPPAEMIRIAAAEPLAFEPGSTYGYSSTNYLVLGEIVWRATGKRIGPEITERLLEPLSLARTTYGRPAAPMRGYDRPGGRKARDVTHWTLGGTSAAGGIWSDARGLARFFSALLGGRVLEPGELERMREITRPSLMGLGIGHEVASCGRTYWGHGGSTPGYETLVLATGDGSTAVVVSANQGGHGVGHELFATAQQVFCRLTR